MYKPGSDIIQVATGYLWGLVSWDIESKGDRGLFVRAEPLRDSRGEFKNTFTLTTRTGHQMNVTVEDLSAFMDALKELLQDGDGTTS